MTGDLSRGIMIDPTVALGPDGAVELSGSVLGAPDIGRVEVEALVDGYERRLGTATVDADGRFTFEDRLRGRYQTFIMVSATDADGRTLSMQTPFTLQGPFGPVGHEVFEQDTYSADGDSLLASTRLFGDGTRFTQVSAPGQTLSVGGSETLDLRGARDTILAISGASGRTVVFGFRASGRGRDAIDLSNTGIVDAADLLNRTTMRNGHAVIHLPGGGAIVLRGVTKARLAHDLDGFRFAGPGAPLQPEPPPVSGPGPMPPDPGPAPTQPGPAPGPMPPDPGPAPAQPGPAPGPAAPDHPPSITVADPAPVTDAAPGVPAPVMVRIADAVTISDPDAGDRAAPYAGGLALQSTAGPAPTSGSLAALFSLDAAAGTIRYDRSAFAYLSQGQKVTATFRFDSASGPDTLPETIAIEVDGANQIPMVHVADPAAVVAATTSASVPVTVGVAAAVTVSDPDASDVATPYAGGLTLRSTTGQAPASGNIGALFKIDAAAGTVSYDSSAFAYLLKDQSVTATFGFETASGPDRLPEMLTVEVDGANVPSAPPVFHLAPSDAGASGANATAASTVTLVGLGTPGDAVALSGSTATQSPTTVVAADGTFRFVNVGLAPGDNSLSASASHYGTAPATASATVTRQDAARSDNSATIWNRLALTAIASSAVDPEIASRALAMESLAVYDAVSAIDGTPGFLFSATAPAGASADAAVAQAAHDVLVAEFPSQKATLDAALGRSLGAVPDGRAKDDGVALGASVAATVVALRADDGATATLVDTGQDGLGRWQPTGPAYMPGEEPQWPYLRPFALTSGDQFVAPPPPALDSRAYADAYNETKSLGGNDATTHRTFDQTEIAKFWSDGIGTYTPPGAWNFIADDAATRTGAGLSQTARTLALLNVAQADVAIATWNTKYAYNTWRPVEAIADGDLDGNPDTTAQAGWTPLITTPPHPEYVSGHSTFSAASADILDSIYGTNFKFTTTSSSLAGVTRSYSGFDQAAAEAGMSRVYGGIHFQFSVDAGAALGKQVADWVLQAFNNSADTLGPAVALDQRSGFATGGDLTVTGHATDNLSGVASLRYALDGGAFASLSVAKDGSFVLPLTAALASAADGTHTLDFVARDAAGNASPLDRIAFTLARTAPSIALSAAGVHDGETVSAGEHLVGTIALPAGDSVTALSYSFDGQPATAVPIAFSSSAGAAAFDAAVDFGELAAGRHSLTVTATDAAGHIGTDTISIVVPVLPLTIASLTPAPMSMDVGVTYRPKITFSRPVDTSTLTSDSYYATDTTGAKLAATIVPLADGTGAWMLFKSPLPGGANVTLHVDGRLIHTADRTYLDAAGTGAAGSSLADTFSTVASLGVPGTTISGIVVDPGPDNQPMTPDDVKGGPSGLLDYAHDTWKLPIAGAKVYILGHEDEAVTTDDDGRFQLTDVPAGDVKVAIDGRTATNSPSGVFFPEMVMDATIRPGVDNTLMGAMGSIQQQAAGAANPVTYLPRVPTDVLTPVSPVTPTTAVPHGAAGTTLTAEQLSYLSLTVQPGSIVDANGLPVALPTVGISPVAPSIVMDMLPPGVLEHTLDVTIQAPGGAVFTKPATLTVPNTFDLAPGSKTYVLSYDHTTGRLVIDGTATVSADGKSIVSDPGADIMAPGWHGVAGPGSRGRGGPDGPCAPSSPAPNADPSIPDYVNAAGEITSGIALVEGVASAIDSNPGAKGLIGRLGDNAGYGFNAASGIQSLVSDNNSIAQDFQDAFNGDTHGNGQFDAQYKAILALKIAGDTAQTALDALNFIVGSLPVFKETSLAKGGQALGLLSSAAHVAGSVAAGDDPFANTTALEQKLAAKEQDIGPKGAWTPPPHLELPAAIAKLDAAKAAAVHDQKERLPYLRTIEAASAQARTFFGQGTDADPQGNRSDADYRSQLADLQKQIAQISDAAEKLAAKPTVRQDLETVLDDLQDVMDAYSHDTGAPLADILSMDMGDDPTDGDGPTIDGREERYGSTLYAVLKNDNDGSVLRFTFDAVKGIDEVLAPNTRYELTIYDSLTGKVGYVTFTTAGSGVDTAIPSPLLLPDRAAPQANGLTASANYVLGFDGAKPANVVPGVSDAAALRSGLYGAASLATTTGVVGGVPLAGEPRKVALASSGSNAAGLTAYVATGSYGLAVVDVTNPRKPVVEGQVALGGTATDVAVDGAFGIAAVALGTSVALVDVSDPTRLKVLTDLPVAATALAIVGGTVYAAAGGMLSAYDLASGRLVASASLGGASAVTGMAVDGTTLYLFDASQTLRIADVSSGAIALEGSLATGAGNGSMVAGNGIVSIAAAPDPLTGGYVTVDVSDPMHPALISGVDAANIVGAAIALNGSGRGVLVGQQNRQERGDGLQNIVDVVNTRDPSNTGAFVSEYLLPAAPYGVAVGAGTAFVADGTAGLQVVNYAAIDTRGVAPTVAARVTTADRDASTSGLQLLEGRVVNVAALVTDDVQARSVELLLDGKPVAAGVTYPWSLSTRLPTIADHGGDSIMLQVRATDTGGNVSVSAPIAVQLVEDTSTPFALVGTSVVDGGAVPEGTTSFTFDFSRPVDPTTVTAADFALRDAKGAAVTPTSLQLQFDGRRVRATYAPLADGGYSFDLRAAAITSTSGQALGSADVLKRFTVAPFTDEWISHASGNWSSAAGWSTGAVPGADDVALASLDPGATLTYDLGDTKVKSLTVKVGTFAVSAAQGYDSQIDLNTLSNTGTVTLAPKTGMQIAGSIDNAGTLAIGADTTARAFLYLDGADVELIGGGVVKLDGAVRTDGSSGSLEQKPLSSNDGYYYAVGNGTILPTISGQTIGYVQYGRDTPATFVNVDNTITGNGILRGEMAVTNAVGGTILAKGGFIAIDPDVLYSGGNVVSRGAGDVKNRGSVVADGGTVQFGAVRLDNETGTIAARNNGLVEFLGTVIDDAGTTITIDDNSGVLFEYRGGLTNDGLPEMDGGTITFAGAGFGIMNATFAGSTIRAGASADLHGRAILDGSAAATTVAASLRLENRSGLKGAVNNAGTLSVDGTEAGTTVSMGPSTRLTGGGTLVLSNRDGAATIAASAGGFSADAISPAGAFRALSVVAAPKDGSSLDNLDNTIRGAGTIQGAANADGTATPFTNEAAGTVLAQDGTLTLDTLSTVNTGTFEVTANGTFVISFTDGGSFANADASVKGTLRATSGTLTIAGDEDQGGFADVLDGTLEYGAAGKDAVLFGSGAGQLVIDHTADFSGYLVQFGGSHALDLRDIDYSASSFTYEPDQGGASGHLVIDRGNIRQSIAFSGSYTTDDFTLSPDNNGGTLLKSKSP